MQNFCPDMYTRGWMTKFTCSAEYLSTPQNYLGRTEIKGRHYLERCWLAVNLSTDINRDPILSFIFQPAVSTTQVNVTQVSASPVIVGVARRDYTWSAIWVCLCCFWPTGIAAIYFANRVSRLPCRAICWVIRKSGNVCFCWFWPIAHLL